jgi:hypothetical protein
MGVTPDVTAENTPFFSYLMLHNFVRAIAMGKDLSGIFGGVQDENAVTSTHRSTQGFALNWNTPLPGLRLGFTYYHTESVTTYKDFVNKVFINVPVQSVEYMVGDFIFMAEKTYTSSKIEGQTDDIALPFEGWYVAGSWHARNWLDLAAVYSEAYPAPEDKKGEGYKALNFDNFMSWQKDFTIASRLNIEQNWYLKFETHFIDGVAQVFPADNPTEQYTKDWILYAVKTGVSF